MGCRGGWESAGADSRISGAHLSRRGAGPAPRRTGRHAWNCSLERRRCQARGIGARRDIPGCSRRRCVIGPALGAERTVPPICAGRATSRRLARPAQIGMICVRLRSRLSGSSNGVYANFIAGESERLAGRSPAGHPVARGRAGTHAGGRSFGVPLNLVVAGPPSCGIPRFLMATRALRSGWLGLIGGGRKATPEADRCG